MTAGDVEICSHHLRAHFFDGDFRHPPKLFLGLGWIAEQGFDLCGTKVVRVDFDDDVANRDGWGDLGVDCSSRGDFLFTFTRKREFDTGFAGSESDKVAYGNLLAGGDDKVVGDFLLEHHPLHADEVLGMAPVAPGIHVAEEQAAFEALGDIGDATGDFAGDEGFATARGLVVEEDAVAGIHPVGLAVVNGDPVGIHLRHGVR